MKRVEAPDWLTRLFVGMTVWKFSGTNIFVCDVTHAAGQFDNASRRNNPSLIEQQGYILSIHVEPLVELERQMSALAGS